MDTKSSGITDEIPESSKKDTKSQIEEYKKLGFREDELIVRADGSVDVGYVDEFRGIAQLLAKENTKKDDS
jgi:hypothetical protein